MEKAHSDWNERLPSVAAGLARDLLVADRFRLVRCLGEGGMGSVWSAQHVVTKRLAALKFVKATSEIAKQRMVREAIAASAVRHRNVVQVHDVLEHASLPVLVMDLLEGETLEARIERAGRLSLEETADVLLPVISAVGTAHAAGVIHRDLKPSNIFLASTGEPTVFDFGIAKVAKDVVEEAPSAATQGILGTPQYMAPEQLLGETLDHRADVWALGVVLYECLAGCRPTHGHNVGAILKRTLSGNIVPLERLIPDLPEAIASLCMRMLRRRRGERPELDEVVRVLTPFGRVTVPPFGPPRAMAPPPAGAPPSSGGVVRDARTNTAPFEIVDTDPPPVAPATPTARLSGGLGRTVAQPLIAVSVVAGALALGAFGARFGMRSADGASVRADGAAPHLAVVAASAPAVASVPAASPVTLQADPVVSAPLPVLPLHAAPARVSRSPRGASTPPGGALHAPPASPLPNDNGAPILD